MIIHAGDITEIETYNTLRDIAPLYAVRGNNDWRLARHLQAFRAFQVEGVNIALVHNYNTLPPPSELADMQIIIFGHTHQYYEQVIDGQLRLNPGSCGQRRFGSDLTMAYLFIDGGSYQVQRVDLDV